MVDLSTPRPYEEWRSKPIDRAEDAAYVFGRDLMRYCRAEALKSVDPAKLPISTQDFQDQIAAAVDIALHNVVDLLEGFFQMDAGPNHRVLYALSVRVADVDGTKREQVEISPCLLDLPIGYWKWKDGEFR